ncbi:MAG: GHKL domain-containing protein [Holosporaceae bacterium]|jgi:signal transduction histidine kinase|nr:GHKL domain-containing protein [Holosporaceae bacterium]
MPTERRVRWSKEALEFFESAPDNGVTLDFVISFGCATQTGEGFEELVNSINNDPVRRKVKKINITDTSYLYRHTMPEFAQYADPNVPTLWFLKNKAAIEKLEVDVSLRQWANGLKAADFEDWHKQMKIDFAGDEDGNGVKQEFREAVISMAEGAVFKGNGLLKQNIEFVLEECAYTCANFKNIVMVYPMSLSPIRSIIERYNLNVKHLPYKMSNHAEQHKNCSGFSNMDRQITEFITKKADNVNFFVVSKTGEIIYKNDACRQQVKDMHVKELAPNVWETVEEVMKTKQQIIVEEESIEGDCYLSVKAPLIAKNKVEGVIGLAVNVTDRKKAEKLEIENRLQKARINEQEEFAKFIARMAHDITSPLISLEYFVKSCENMPEDRQKALKSIATSIKSIAGDLLDRYIKFRGDFCAAQDQDILVSLALSEVVSHKRYQYKDSNVKFHYSYDPTFKFAFIRGDQSKLSRAISNLVNNSAEAFEDKRGVIDISFAVENGNVKILVKDDGKGMPKTLVDKINAGNAVNTTKETGHGIGLEQVISAVALYGGRLFVESEEGRGTTATLIFPELRRPDWLAEQVSLRKNDTVVVVDDEKSIHHVWKTILKDRFKDSNLIFFTNYQEASSFIESKKGNNLFLLADFELKDRGSNGLDLIRDNKLEKRSLIVTNCCDQTTRELAEQSGVKILPKQFISEIKVRVTG